VISIARRPALKFYVGRNAETTADVLWAAHDVASNTRSNSAANSANSAEEKPDATDCHVERCKSGG
jgi:hypothetical protein